MRERERPRTGEPEAAVVGAVFTPHPTLAAAVSPMPIRDKLTWDLHDISLLTGLSRRLLERELAAGRMPKCDLRVGRRCLWRPASIRAWIEGGRP